MGLRVQTNMQALLAHGKLTASDKAMGRSSERLSSGYRINHAADDAAGLAIANKLRNQVRSLGVAQRNASEAIAVIQTAEGAMNQIEGILERMKELATQAASDNVTNTERGYLNTEFTNMKNEIERIADDTKYQDTALIHGTYGDYVSALSGATAGLVTAGISINGAAAGTYTITDANGTLIKITGPNGTDQTATAVNCGAQSVSFAGLGITLSIDSNYDNWDELNNVSFAVSAGSGGTFHIGNENETYDKFSFNIDGVTTDDLAITDDAVDTRTKAQTAITAINSALNTLNASLGSLGAYQNTFEFASANLAVTIENASSSQSVIRDVDMASEMMSYTKNQILVQAGTAMLAQANQAPQMVLQLFS